MGHMQLAAHLGDPDLPLPLGSFHSLDYGATGWKFRTSVATLAHMEGTGWSLVSLKIGPGNELRKIFDTTCSSVRNMLSACSRTCPQMH